MNIHEIVTVALGIFAGFFCGQATGYRQANREYKAAVDGAVEAMQNGAKIIEKLRQRLVAKRIVAIKQLGKPDER